MKRLLKTLLLVVMVSTGGCITFHNVENKTPIYNFVFAGNVMIRVNHRTGDAWIMTPDG